jgi:Na+-transporting methylmalonyl-CoA/oxaloacetate decarboxylase gamma subunit
MVVGMALVEMWLQLLVLLTRAEGAVLGILVPTADQVVAGLLLLNIY